jgi:hypothetical protein
MKSKEQLEQLFKLCYFVIKYKILLRIKGFIKFPKNLILKSSAHFK